MYLSMCAHLSSTVLTIMFDLRPFMAIGDLAIPTTCRFLSSTTGRRLCFSLIAYKRAFAIEWGVQVAVDPGIRRTFERHKTQLLVVISLSPYFRTTSNTSPWWAKCRGRNSTTCTSSISSSLSANQYYYQLWKGVSISSNPLYWNPQ